jgi:hypothetical protein
MVKFVVTLKREIKLMNSFNILVMAVKSFKPTTLLLEHKTENRSA